MKEFGLKSSTAGLESIGIHKVAEAHWNLSPAELVEHALHNKEGVLTDKGALNV